MFFYYKFQIFYLLISQYVIITFFDFFIFLNIFLIICLYKYEIYLYLKDYIIFKYLFSLRICIDISNYINEFLFILDKFMYNLFILFNNIYLLWILLFALVIKVYVIYILYIFIGFGQIVWFLSIIFDYVGWAVIPYAEFNEVADILYYTILIVIFILLFTNKITFFMEDINKIDFKKTQECGLILEELNKFWFIRYEKYFEVIFYLLLSITLMLFPWMTLLVVWMGADDIWPIGFVSLDILVCSFICFLFSKIVCFLLKFVITRIEKKKQFNEFIKKYKNL